MDWNKLFKLYEIELDLQEKVLRLFRDSSGKNKHAPETIVIVLASSLMQICSDVGMSNEDMSDFLDAIDEQYPGW